MLVANISQFRNNMKDYVEKVMVNHDTLIVNSNGKAFVVMSLEDYNSLDATEYLLSTVANKKRLFKALEESQQKKGVEVKLDAAKKTFIKVSKKKNG